MGALRRRQIAACAARRAGSRHTPAMYKCLRSFKIEMMFYRLPYNFKFGSKITQPESYVGSQQMKEESVRRRVSDVEHDRKFGNIFCLPRLREIFSTCFAYLTHTEVGSSPVIRRELKAASDGAPRLNYRNAVAGAACDGPARLSLPVSSDRVARVVLLDRCPSLVSLKMNTHVLELVRQCDLVGSTTLTRRYCAQHTKKQDIRSRSGPRTLAGDAGGRRPSAARRAARVYLTIPKLKYQRVTFTAYSDLSFSSS
ncbi:hypothetical protein EVAR_98257_1 [Eumeta japonica]|uniref:Uncharacterized protein n=1 Tax=Eumeta variegata TaxID=151549 RepID=A0A4C1Y457_EUMVA|nr:hypothetical protein EVAR_98257_1 [Eumeta japonica]